MAIIEHIYAELLINVRIITLFVQVSPHAAGSEVSVALSNDGAGVKLLCQNDIIHVPLPTKVSLSQSGDHRFLPADSQEKSIRLSLDQSWHQSQDPVKDATPWSASGLRDVECAHCRKCRRDIIRPGVISAWKDLPSENWAEMMDFWHCHKPDETVSFTDTAKVQEQKGYSASNKLAAQAGLGFVDISHLLLAREDCSNITTVGEITPSANFST